MIARTHPQAQSASLALSALLSAVMFVLFGCSATSPCQSPKLKLHLSSYPSPCRLAENCKSNKRIKPHAAITLCYEIVKSGGSSWHNDTASSALIEQGLFKLYQLAKVFANILNFFFRKQGQYSGVPSQLNSRAPPNLCKAPINANQSCLDFCDVEFVNLNSEPPSRCPFGPSCLDWGHLGLGRLGLSLSFLWGLVSWRLHTLPRGHVDLEGCPFALRISGPVLTPGKRLRAESGASGSARNPLSLHRWHFSQTPSKTGLALLRL